MSNTEPTEAQIVAAARVLNKRHAALCNVNEADSWAIQGDDFREDARAALRAALAESTHPADASKSGAQIDMGASVEPADPMDWPLPCDVKVGHGTHGKGTPLRTLVKRMKLLYDMAQQSASASMRAPAASGEPVAWRWIPSEVWGSYVVSDDKALAEQAEHHGIKVQPLYTAPPAPALVPLTDEQIQAAWDSVDMRHPRGDATRNAFAGAIERAHGITGEPK